MKSQIIAMAVATAFVGFSATALAADTTTTSSSTTSSSTTSSVKTISFTLNCPGGGTRVSSGTYDATSGAVSLTVTVTKCTLPSKEVQDGTKTISGTIGTASNAYAENVTISENFTATRDNATKLTHTCTVTRKGTYDTSTNLFTGTVSRNCTNDGSMWDHEGWLENMLRQTEEVPVPATPAGVMPMLTLDNPRHPAMGGPGGGMGNRW